MEGVATADDDYDARFAEIVGPLSATMEWDLSEPASDTPGATSGERPADTGSAQADRTAGGSGTLAAHPRPENDSRPTRSDSDVTDAEHELRRIRREQRRMERAAELAEFNAEKAALEAEYSGYNSADDHFTPPDPPPLPRFRRATVGAVLLVIAGIALIASPALLAISQELTILVGAVLIGSGVAVLASRLRSDNDEGPGAVL
jgi:hypothetical protein